MMKQKFYEYMDRYMMAMGIDIEEYAGLKELTLQFIALQAALECQSLFDVAWDCDPCNKEEEGDMRSYTPDLEDLELVGKLRVLVERGWKRTVTHV